MPETDGSLSNALTIALLLMVIFSTSTPVLGAGTPQQAPQTDLGNSDTQSTIEYTACVEFTQDDVNQCSSLNNVVSVGHTVINTQEPGKMKLAVDANIARGLNANYAVKARADDGSWSQAPLPSDGSEVILSVENTYTKGSLQYPSLYIRIINTDTGESVGYNSYNFDSPVTIPSGDETAAYDEDFVTETADDTDSTEHGATVVGDDQREVLQPTYSSATRFIDSDSIHEPFEDPGLPPVRYDEAGTKTAGPHGNIKYFDNLREGGGNATILAHQNGQMNLGTAIYGIPSAEFQKMRIDYALQTEASTQTVQVRLVNQYGDLIDPATKNSVHRQLTQTLSDTDASFFNERKQYENALYEDNLNTNTIEFTLTTAEREYLAENNEAYITYNTDKRAYLLLYRTPIISQSIENSTGDDFVPELKHFEEEFNENQGTDDTATFDAVYRIQGTANDKYGSFDREPGDPVKLQVTVTNNGDSRVERHIGIYSMSDNNKTLYGANAEAKIIDKRSVGVEPRSSKTFQIEFDYEPHEYGYHNITVLDTTDPNNPEQIGRERDGAALSKVYVLQPATFEVTQVLTPNSWLVHDNFNTTVVVQNVGDMNGSAVLNAEFQQWNQPVSIPETEGGNVRQGAPGSYANITFNRDNANYSPSYPESPTQRPLSPHGTELTWSNNENNPSTAPDVRSKFDATTTHPFAAPNPKLYDSINHSMTSDTIRIYKLDITTITVEGKHGNSDSWYASGSPIHALTGSDYWTAGLDVTDNYDALNEPVDAMPTQEGVRYIYPPVQVADETNQMTVEVIVRNEGEAPVGTARVKVLTDGTGFDGTNVAGVAGADGIGPWDTKRINVPIALANEYGNGGTHWLSAHIREDPDYIQRLNPDDNNIDTNNPDDQFETTVQVELWADFLYQNTTVQDTTINEKCAGTRPSDSDGELTDCTTAQEQSLTFSQYHQNVGGEAGTLTVDAYIEAYDDPSQSSDFSNFGWVSNPLSESTNFWNAQSLYLIPSETETYTASNVPFDEPGIYRIKQQPHRTNNEGGNLASYEDTGYVPQDEWRTFKVLDITSPESHGEITDTTYTCKSGICENADGTWTVWEGATVEFTNYSVDNVVIDTIEWGGVNYNGGYTDCHGQINGGCYSEVGVGSDTGANSIAHRFSSPGTYDITLTSRDHPAYAPDAPLDGTGTPNSDTDTYPITVKDDTNNPSASVTYSSSSNPDNSPDGFTIWHTNSDTNYDGIIVCYTASSSDTEIGIEADEWTGVSGAENEDNRCRTYSSSGEKTVTYDAWDFAGNHDSGSTSIYVAHDNTDPSVSLSGSRSSSWVEKGWHSSSVSWSGTTSDDETGLINCYDGGAYTWSGDTNGDASSCSDSFTTTYTSASESGTEFKVTLKATDYHGNTNSDSASVTQYEDKTDPYVEGETKSCSADTNTDGCSVTACVTYNDEGPQNGGIGIYKTEGAGGDGCVTASADADASASASASTPSSCGETNTDYDYDYDTDSETNSATVTVYDKHGNSESAYIEASASDEDEDSDWDSASSDPCDDGGGGGGGGDTCDVPEKYGGCVSNSDPSSSEVVLMVNDEDNEGAMDAVRANRIGDPPTNVNKN